MQKGTIAGRDPERRLTSHGRQEVARTQRCTRRETEMRDKRGRTKMAQGQRSVALQTLPQVVALDSSQLFPHQTEGRSQRICRKARLACGMWAATAVDKKHAQQAGGPLIRLPSLAVDMK